MALITFLKKKMNNVFERIVILQREIAPNRDQNEYNYNKLTLIKCNDEAGKHSVSA